MDLQQPIQSPAAAATSSSTPAPPTAAKETKVKIRRPRQPKAEGSTTNKKDKTIKIKLTAKGNQNNHTEFQNHSLSGGNGSEEEDDPETAIEEQMIFRVPQGELCERLHELVKKREIPEDVKLNFRESRKGQLTFEGRKYDVALVDLPTVIESQKTLDKKQFYKVADISQMILVDPTSGSEPFIPQSNGRHETTDPYNFSHGLTPPLKHVRQRRFRKKLSKRAIEEVEKEVERLLEVDATAEDVQYEVVDNRDIESENDHELLSDAGTQDQDIDIDDSDMDSGSDAEDVLAATIEGLMDLEDNEEDDGEDRSEEEDESEEDEDDEDEDEEEDDDAQTGEIEQKKQEIAELKQAIQRKTRDLSTAPNAMLKTRFETDISNLKKSLTLKEAHLAEMNEKEKENK